jgi:D-glycerate 3-kinase
MGVCWQIVEIIKHSMSKPPTAQQIIRQLIVDEHLPADFASLAMAFFLPLADYISQCHLRRQQTVVVGINGAQGTGKSTLSELLKRWLQARQLTCVVLSIDDLYLTRAQRSELARDVHPLLQTRGVPGTHDLALGLSLLAALKSATTQTRVELPKFNKAQDDRRPLRDWKIHQGSVDVIVIEGWCVGAQPASLAGEPINRLEREQDADGRWRAFIEQQLLDYQRLFCQFDLLVMLKAPSMDSIIEWRSLQETKLQTRTAGEVAAGVMSVAELRWFIMHYERLTRIMLETLPDRADVLFGLTPDHRIVNARYRPLAE